MKLKRFFPLFLIVAVAFFLSLSIDSYLCDGFSKKHIHSKRQEFQVVKVADPTIVPILAQNYFYKEKGSQCYVFESQDGEYVLKFFRFQRYKSKKRSIEDLIESCELAFRELKNETHLLTVHLNKTNELKIQVKCFDKMNRAFLVDMDEVEFILQRKATSLYPYLSELIESNKKQEAKEALANLVHLLNQRMEKGIFDGDAALIKNAGFYDGQAMFIDIGQFKKQSQDQQTAQLELKKVTSDLKTWLESKDQELVSYLDELTSKQVL